LKKLTPREEHTPGESTCQEYAPPRELGLPRRSLLPGLTPREKHTPGNQTAQEEHTPRNQTPQEELTPGIDSPVEAYSRGSMNTPGSHFETPYFFNNEQFTKSHKSKLSSPFMRLLVVGIGGGVNLSWLI